MAFNIRNFKSRAANQGFLRSHSYDVNLALPAGLGGGEEINIRTESVAIPGAAFLTVDNYRPYSSGKIYNIPYSYNPQDIAMVHTIDSEANLLRTFWSWIDLIADIKGAGRFAANYHDEYATKEMTINVYNHERKVKTITVYEVFPMSIDQMQMSWGSNDETAKLNVNYRYSHYEVKQIN